MGQPFDRQLWDLACQYKFFVSTMLAVSACHLRHHTANASAHHIAELGQLSAAITTLQPALTAPMQKDRADALLCTAVMLNAVTFASVVGQSLSTSWVFSESADRLQWLDLQMQYKKLEEATFQFRESSLLQPILDASDTQVPCNDAAEDTSLEEIPPDMVNVDREQAYAKLQPYLEPVSVLAQLRLAEPDCYNSFAYIGLLKKLRKGFRDLLYERDLPALWIFGYWLGLLGRLNIWWCSPRVERDWAAVLCFLREKNLHERPGDEGRSGRRL